MTSVRTTETCPSHPRWPGKSSRDDPVSLRMQEICGPPYLSSMLAPGDQGSIHRSQRRGKKEVKNVQEWQAAEKEGSLVFSPQKAGCLLAERGFHAMSEASLREEVGRGQRLWGSHTISVATAHSAKDKYKRTAVVSTHVMLHVRV